MRPETKFFARWPGVWSMLCEKADTVARMGGDEFLVLLPEVGVSDQAGEVARKLLATMAREPFVLDRQSLPLSFSIGIAFYPDHCATSAELLTHADSALYAAKRAGKNQFAYFNGALASSAVR